jgi:hypothetical protein
MDVMDVLSITCCAGYRLRICIACVMAPRNPDNSMNNDLHVPFTISQRAGEAVEGSRVWPSAIWGHSPPRGRIRQQVKEWEPDIETIL